MNWTLGPDPMINDSLDNPVSTPPVRPATGAAGRRHGPSPAEVWDHLEVAGDEALEGPSRSGWADRFEHPSELGADVARMEQRVSALEAGIAPSHRE
ncbi:hypothetical protein PF008_g21702 [Phytophthora fragariae]|uniref:Uncharacterized protein n=1 Tax=Phytophthora fragariae TaxID=53985 RepID=A0A6G0QVU5_9STRA|nr:hypothetical protein PF008_g21702 [Phytophthora fragariae]